MPFHTLELALHLAATLKPVLEKLRSHDKDLSDQTRRAVTSVALNLSEGRLRAAKDRLHHFRIAAGSLSEARTALRIAAAWGYLEPTLLEHPEHLMDRLASMLWKLARPFR